MGTNHSAMSTAADAALNNSLDDRVNEHAQAESVDRHQERIDAYKDQIVENEIPAAAAIGGITADLLTVTKIMGSTIRKSLEGAEQTLETFQVLGSVLASYSSLTRQIDRNESLIQRIEAQHAEKLRTARRISNITSRLGTTRNLSAHRDSWQHGE